MYRIITLVDLGCENNILFSDRVAAFSGGKRGTLAPTRYRKRALQILSTKRDLIINANIESNGYQIGN